MNIEDVFNAAREGRTIGGMGGPFEYKYDTIQDFINSLPSVPRITRHSTVKVHTYIDPAITSPPPMDQEF